MSDCLIRLRLRIGARVTWLGRRPGTVSSSPLRGGSASPSSPRRPAPERAITSRCAACRARDRRRRDSPTAARRGSGPPRPSTCSSASASLPPPTRPASDLYFRYCRAHSATVVAGIPEAPRHRRLRHSAIHHRPESIRRRTPAATSCSDVLPDRPPVLFAYLSSFLSFRPKGRPAARWFPGYSARINWRAQQQGRVVARVKEPAVAEAADRVAA